MRSRFKTTIITAALGLLMQAGAALAAADPHAGHHGGTPAVAASSDTKVPGLRLLMPQAGDCVEGQMAIVIETDADLDQATMSAARIGTHLHIGIDDKSMMPVREQLFSAGNNRYVYLLDLPVDSGKHQVSVYWAGADHQTIETSVQRVEIKVRNP